MYNVNISNFHATICALEKLNTLHIPTALFTQHAMALRQITICGLSSSTIFTRHAVALRPINTCGLSSSTIFLHEFRRKVIERKYAFRFYLQTFSEIYQLLFHGKNCYANAQHYYKYTQIDFPL
jgi:hypothetical protein